MCVIGGLLQSVLSAGLVRRAFATPVTLHILHVLEGRIDRCILLFMSVGGGNEFVSLFDLYEPQRPIASISLLTRSRRSRIDWPPAMSVNR